MKRYNKDEFIQLVKDKYNFDYDYTLTEYINMDYDITIYCNKHGPFVTSARRHFYRGHGCQLCKTEKLQNHFQKSTEEFVKDAKLIHGDLYDYSKVKYEGAHKKVEIICSNHGSFWQRPTNHLKPLRGCPSCAKTISRSCTLWLDSLNIKEREITIKINGQSFRVDGFDSSTNTIYEYFGYFWHGHPAYYKAEDIHPRIGVTFGSLYQKTIERIKTFESAGYKIIYKWGK